MMDLTKYKDHLFRNMKIQLSKWFDQQGNELVPEQDIYRFLHSIKGTAGTLQLAGLLQISENLIRYIDENSEKAWDKTSLRNFLFDLIGMTYEYEHFEEAAPKSNKLKGIQVPLIQIIDDDISMLILLKDVLEEQGWMVITATRPEKAIQQYFDMQPDCLIIDVNLPEKSGFQILSELQDHNDKFFIPTIMMSVTNNKETRLNALKKGADDFISKPVDIDEFVARVGNHLKRKKIFERSSLIDELTQVYNRRFFDLSLPRYFDSFKRTHQPFTIALIDIDYFKKINDTYGHQIGDMVLYQFSAFLKENMRSSDTVFRYGGEEFAIVFPDTTSEEIESRINELIQQFSLLPLIAKEDQPRLSITFSAGLFTVTDETVTREHALNLADMALYEAKNNGRARVELAGTGSGSISNKEIKITVIDDDVVIRTILNQILHSINVEKTTLDIAVFEEGRTFLQSDRIQGNTDHFLILDGVMPIMDGLEVLQKVKQLTNSHHFKVLMLTGRKSEYDIARALKLGADDYVTKPFSITELQARIERMLKRVK
ncbi:diguanylate cyclase [Peribacillus sp. SCS-155]|uniref:diguanylate cyclase n=1 Tax=Peribacillus sedimenti TaxID=3115297 RepID=UPI003906B39F